MQKWLGEAACKSDVEGACRLHSGLHSGLRSGFLRGQRMERERVNLVLHERAERVVDQAVTCDAALAGKARRDDTQGVVPAAARSTRVAGMQGAVVADVNGVRLQRGEALTYL